MPVRGGTQKQALGWGVEGAEGKNRGGNGLVGAFEKGGADGGVGILAVVPGIWGVRVFEAQK